MAIVKYNPNNSLMRFFNDDLFDSFLSFPFGERSLLNDISETDKEFKVEFMLPGFKKEEVKLAIENDVLSISAERKEKNKYFNEIKKSYSLPENLDTENVDAKLEDGVLKILIPKLKEEKVEPKLIEVK